MQSQILELTFNETDEVGGGTDPVTLFLAAGAIAAAAVALMELGERLHDAYCIHK